MISTIRKLIFILRLVYERRSSVLINCFCPNFREDIDCLFYNRLPSKGGKVEENVVNEVVASR